MCFYSDTYIIYAARELLVAISYDNKNTDFPPSGNIHLNGFLAVMC